MHGKTCAGTWVTGTGKDGNARDVYLYHVSDNDECMARYGSQAVVLQTALNPVGMHVKSSCSGRARTS
jgi:saccharopine dehydrogenase (NAD+, L-lysine forming)